MLTANQSQAAAEFRSWLRARVPGVGKSVVLVTGDRRSGMTFMLDELRRIYGADSIVIDDAEKKSAREFERALRADDGGAVFVGAHPPARASGEWTIRLKDGIERGEIRGVVLPLRR